LMPGGVVVPDPDRLTELFLELTAVSSPSRAEADVARIVRRRLQDMGLDADEDDTAASVGGNCGNLACLVEGEGERPHVALGAHLDTVLPTEPIEPILEDDVFRNRRAAILGADDKAAVAALLHATELLRAGDEPFPTYELFFTVGEEDGLLGAKHLAATRLPASPLAVIFDASGEIGGIVVRAPSRNGLQATFRGRAAHAGLEPEEGRNAIFGAARAIAVMELGRLDERTTANIGLIHGGTATNIVPDVCHVEGECRSQDDVRLAQVTAAMVDAFELGAAEAMVDVELRVINDVRAFSLKERSAPVRLAKAAVKALGLTPRLLAREGASDANVLNAAGLPTVNLACAMTRVHTPNECMKLSDLVQLTRLIVALVQLAPEFGRRPAPGKGV
jgi:tripeptide aminopeptidase